MKFLLFWKSYFFNPKFLLLRLSLIFSYKRHLDSASSSNTNNLSIIYDPSHNSQRQLYLHSDKKSGSILTAPQLNELDYHNWSKLMKQTLSRTNSFSSITLFLNFLQPIQTSNCLIGTTTWYYFGSLKIEIPKLLKDQFFWAIQFFLGEICKVDKPNGITFDSRTYTKNFTLSNKMITISRSTLLICKSFGMSLNIYA